MEIYSRGYCLILFGMFLWVAWEDVRWKRIGNGAVVCLFLVRTFVLALGCFTESGRVAVWSAIGGFVFGGGIFLLIYWRTKGGVGAGDVKLLAVVGYYVGIEKVWDVMFWAAWITVVWSAGVQRKGLQERIALAPFVLAGMAVTALTGGLG